MSEELPQKIKHIDIVRIERGRRKICRCEKPKYEIDNVNRLVMCTECQAIVDPYEAVYNLALHYERLAAEVNYLLEQRKQILNYKPHLVVIKSLEQEYRRMLPLCPKCGEVFDLKEICKWTSKETGR